MEPVKKFVPDRGKKSNCFPVDRSDKRPIDRPEKNIVITYDLPLLSVSLLLIEAVLDNF